MSGKNKTQIHLVPPEAIIETAKAFQSGLKKEGRKEGDWKKLEPLDLYDAAQRHMLDYLRGVRADHESGLHPLAHAMASLAGIIWQDVASMFAVDKTPTPAPVTVMNNTCLPVDSQHLEEAIKKGAEQLRKHAGTIVIKCPRCEGRGFVSASTFMCKNCDMCSGTGEIEK